MMGRGRGRGRGGGMLNRDMVGIVSRVGLLRTLVAIAPVLIR